jgi:hypothetical protein
MEDAISDLGCPRARTLGGDGAGGEAAARRQPRLAIPYCGFCSWCHHLLALRRLHSPPGCCSRASNRCIDLQEEPKISSATATSPQRRRNQQNSKNTNLYCSRGRGHRQAHALRGAALHDWGRDRGGRYCAGSTAACPARSACLRARPSNNPQQSGK